MNDSRVFKVNFLLVVLGLVLCLMLTKLAELQLVFGSNNRKTADNNRLRQIANPAPRGLIFDRAKRQLVENIPLYRSCEVEEKTQTIVCRKLLRDEALRAEVEGGVNAEKLRTDVGRNYPYGKVLAHLLGYLGEVNEDEVKNGSFRLGDFVGRMGMEQQYEKNLRGVNGLEVTEVNTQGEIIRDLGKIEPVAGENLYLTVDAELSRVAYEALAGRPGAVVATEAKTGKVLVLVSSPSFDPNNLETKYFQDPQTPLFFRTISGTYPPGSVFKIVTATAAIEEGKVDQNTLYKDSGIIQIGDFSFKNWYFTQYGRTEGEIGIVKAISRSTDTFFYKVGEWTGAQKVVDWAMIYGLGAKTGINLPGEAAGLVPDPQKEWYLGNTYHLAIGQGDLLVTPLQQNQLGAVIANNGKWCKPILTENEAVDCRDLNLKKETLDLIKDGLVAACSPGGTAYPLFDFKPQVACKTGTAEIGDKAENTHAWLTAFAPADDPQIVVTVLVEAGGQGSDQAAPIARKVLEKWFGR